MRINTAVNGEAKLQCLGHLILGLLLPEQCYKDQCWEEKKQYLLCVIGFIRRINSDYFLTYIKKIITVTY